jgi:GTP:adenosylcobinamide-phosphate guanylyltransferase
MFAMLLAGGTLGQQESLFPYAPAGQKALIDVSGKPMVRWVLEALEGAELIDAVVVIGLEHRPDLEIAKATRFISDQGGLLANARSGLRHIERVNPRADRVLVISGDIPTVSSEMVDWRCQAALDSDADLSYLAIERDVMESRFPGSSRSYVRVQNLQLCGGDCHCVRTGVLAEEALWERLISARKNPLRQAALIGYGTLLGLLLRRLTLPGAERRISQRLGINGRVQLSPYAELGMDVDTPQQLEMLRGDIARRGI